MPEIRMDLARIIISDNSDQQVVILRERDGDRQFPIVIGDAEARAIQRRISGLRVSRPLTHDLLASVIEQLHGELEKIVINDLKESTFFARLHIRCRDSVVEVDSRPSDALALGAASETPVYVEESVLRKVCA